MGFNKRYTLVLNMLYLTISLASLGLSMLVLTLFMRQAYVKQRSVPHLIAVALFMVVNTMLSVLSFVVKFNHWMNMIVDLTNMAAWFFVFLLAQEIRSVRVHPVQFAIVFGCVIWYIIPRLFWTDDDNIGAVPQIILIVAAFGWFSYSFSVVIPVLITYVRILNQTKERPAKMLVFGFTFYLIGYLSGLIEYLAALVVGPEILGIVSTITGFFPLVALFLVMLTYLVHLDYVYRLPDDYYVIMLAYKNGIPIQIIKLVSKNDVNITEDLLAGFLSAVNSMFRETLHAKQDITIIASGDAKLVSESAEFITGIIVGSKDTAILRRALRTYLRMFEQRFQTLVSQYSPDITMYETAREELTSKCFPFFRVAA
jgi:hypothetical protein